MKPDGRRGDGRAWRRQGTTTARLPRAPRLDTLDACQSAWTQAKNPLALVEVVRLCATEGGIPAWLSDELLAILKMPTIARAKAGRKRWRRYRADLADFARAEEVAAALRGMAKWDQAYEIAAERLSDTPASGGHDAMKKSYFSVKRTAVKTPGRYAVAPRPAK